MLSVKGPPFQDPLNRFGHVEPTATERSVERHDPMIEEPEHEVDRVMPLQVVPDQEHPERWEIWGERDPDAESILPAFPAAAIVCRREHRRFRQHGQDGRQFGVQPGMEHGIWGTPYADDPDGTTGRMEERQLFGGSGTHVLVWRADWLSGGVPMGTGIGQRLIGSGLIFRPDRQVRLGVGGLDQVFLGTASGSVTSTGPLFRLRTTVPVAHQLRSLLQVSPASWSTDQMVYVLTVGRPSAACRKARWRVTSDQVAVPSRSRSGVRRTSCRIRACSRWL